MLTFGSLFSGIGGFDLGFERAGLRCVWQVEKDEFCRRVLRKHWPSVPQWDDVTTFDGEGFERPDVIIGGFPCKQTSRAAAIRGNRIGLRGNDSKLWYEMRRIIQRMQPRYVAVENPESDWLTEVETDLAKAGYSVSRTPISAADVGAPHIRGRMFLLAHANQPGLAVTRSQKSSQAKCLTRAAPQRNPWLSSFAGLLRVDDGISPTMDRRKRIIALGNAVVPQVAEVVAKRLLEIAGRIEPE
jgi:DNA (cytosine-5)-methyltransferase 1